MVFYNPSSVLVHEVGPTLPIFAMGPSTPKITNTYLVCTLATIGGLLQGFDVSSLSAILASDQVRFHPFAVQESSRPNGNQRGERLAGGS